MISCGTTGTLLPDAHTHIHHDPRAIELVAAAARLGVRPVVVCATSAADFDDVLRLRDATARGSVLAGLGVHPWHAADLAEPETLATTLSALRARLRADPTLHVGEIGVDKAPRALALCPLDVQLRVFRAQLGVAASECRVVNIHCVRAFPELVESLRGWACQADGAGGADVVGRACPGLSGAILHSWGGSAAQARDVVAALPSGTPAVFSFQGDCVTTVAQAFERALGQPAAVDGSGEVARESHQASEGPDRRIVGPGEVSDAQSSGLSDSADVGCGCGMRPAILATEVPGLLLMAGGVAAPTAAAPATTASPPPAHRGASKQTMACLAQLPPSALVFETDAPYQPFPAAPRYDAWCAAVFGCPLPSDSDSHAPASVLRVVQAAAVWRCLRAPKVPLLKVGRSGGSGGGACSKGSATIACRALGVQPATVPPSLVPPPQTGWPSSDAVRAEFALLVAHSAANIARLRVAGPSGAP